MLTRIGLMIVVSMGVTGCGNFAQSVHDGIEVAGEEAMGVPVRVTRMHLNLMRGSGEISGVTIGNPDGYQEAYAFQIDLARLNLKVLSLLGGSPFVLDELVIDSPVLTFEANAQGGSNLKDIADHIGSKQKPVESEQDEADPGETAPTVIDPPPVEPATDTSPKEPLRIAIRRLVIRGVTYHHRRVDGTSFTGTLPAVMLEDVGSPEGETLGGLSAVVMLTLARQMFVQRVASQLGDTMASLEAMDQDVLLQEWENLLSLTEDQVAELKPLLEEQCLALQNVFDQVQAQGFLDVGVLAEKFATAGKQVREHLEDVLTPAQVKEIETLFDELGRRTQEDIWDRLVQEMTGFLGLSPEQMERLGPALRDQVRKRTELLGRFVAHPDQSFEGLLMEYETLQEETRRLLGDVLDAEQMVAFAENQKKLHALVEGACLGPAQP